MIFLIITLKKSLDNAFTGQGIKKTFSYISHLSKEDLLKKREEFWGFYIFFMFFMILTILLDF